MRRNLKLLIFLISAFFCFSQNVSQIECPTNYYINTQSANLTCVATCPVWTYIGTIDNKTACLNQSRILATAHPTVEEKTFILKFSNGPVPFANASDFEERTKVYIFSPFLNTTSNVSALFLTEDKTVVQFELQIDNIPMDSTLAMYFPNFQLDNSSQTYIGGPAIFTSLPYTQLTVEHQDLVSTLTKLDRGLEYAWIALTCLNPYAFLYTNTKLYRETLEMFKRINVQYGPLATSFFSENNNKVSGFKAPNMFPIIITDNNVTSGWNRGEENSLPFGSISSDRARDLEIPVIDSEYSYDPYGLFLDNYGIQITVFFAIMVLIAFFEILNYVIYTRKGEEANETKSGRFFHGIRVFLRWNLLLGSILGSYQSLMFYVMIQIQAFASGDTHNSDNKLSFWFAIGTFIILGLMFPVWLICRLVMIYKDRRDAHPDFKEDKDYYGLFFMFNNLDRPSTLTFFLSMQVRAIILACLTTLVFDRPTSQIGSMVALSVVFAIYVAIFRPYARALYNVYQVLNEIAVVCFLTTLLYLDYQRDHGSVDYDQGEISGFVLIAFWLLVPALGILFGIVGIAMRLSGYSTQTTLIPIPTEKRSIEQPNELILMPKTSQDRPEVSHGEGNYTANSAHETYIRSPNTIALNIAFDNITKEQPRKAAAVDHSRSVLTIPCPVYEETERRRQAFFTGAMTMREDHNNSQMRSPNRQEFYDNSRVYDPAESDFEYKGGRLPNQRLSNSKFSSHQQYGDDGEEMSPRMSRRSRAGSLNLEKISNFKKRPASVNANRGEVVMPNQRERSNERSKFDSNTSRRKKFMTAYQLKTKFLEDEGFKMFKERFAFDDDS